MSMELVLPFLNQTEDFVLGFEAGTVWHAMRSGENLIEGTYHERNRAQLLMMAQRAGYGTTYEAPQDGWVQVRFSRKEDPPFCVA